MLRCLMLTTLITALATGSFSSKSVQPMSYFYHANNIPYDLYSRYLCNIFRDNGVTNVTSEHTGEKSEYKALEDLLAPFSGQDAPKSQLRPGYVPLAGRYENSSSLNTISKAIRRALGSELNELQLRKLRSVLETSLTLCDLKRLLEAIYRVDTDKALEASYLLQQFLVPENVSNFVSRKSLTEIILASNYLQNGIRNGLKLAPTVKDVVKVAFRNLLPAGLTREQIKDAEMSMIVLSSWKMTRSDIESIFNNCSQVLLLAVFLVVPLIFMVVLVLLLVVLLFFLFFFWWYLFFVFFLLFFLFFFFWLFFLLFLLLFWLFFF
ncbi:mucin-2 [Biomphalaria glabrata]|nr:mucin-2-like [Biomphalaria glabrata]